MQQNRAKYLVVAGIILVGGSYIIFRKYREISRQIYEDAQSNIPLITSNDPKTSQLQQNDDHDSSDEYKTSTDRKADKAAVSASTNKFPIQVFVRMRPLVGKEIEEKHEEIEYEVKPFIKVIKKKRKNENILCAIIALMRELDKNGLEFVKKDANKRL